MKPTQALNKSGLSEELSPVVSEFLSEIDAGRNPSRDQFLEMHPELTDQLDQALTRRRLLRNAGQDLEIETNDVALTRMPLGDFRLIRPIGRGGMGVVYEAEQLSLRRIVAVKVLPFASMLDVQQQKRFRNEARAAATLDHPNIVPVYYVGHERGVHFYAMQLIDGQSLAEVITFLRSPDGLISGRAEPPTAEQTGGTIRMPASNLSSQHSMGSHEFFRTVAKLGSQAAAALAHAHDIGIVHRDVKPGNLMVDVNGKLWVTDFGLARFDHGDQLTITGGVIGTYGYMSPEQAAGSRLVDPRSDVYSLGATLHELLAPRQTAPSATTHSVVAATEVTELTPLRELDRQVPIDLETIVMKATALERSDRYQTARDLGEDLRRFSIGANIHARRLTFFERSVRALSRHRLAVAITAVSGLVLLAIATVAISAWSAQIAHYADSVDQALVEKQRALDAAELAQSVSERQRRLAEVSLHRAETSELRALRMSYRSDIQLAYRHWLQNQWNDATRYLNRHRSAIGVNDVRGVEWYLLYNDLTEKSTTLGRHEGLATECELFPDGRTAVTVGEDGRVRLWDLTSKRHIRSFDPGLGDLHAVAVSVDGSSIAVGGGTMDRMNDQSCVMVLSAFDGRERHRLHTHQTTIESIVYSADGELIASGSRYQNIKVSRLDESGLVTLPAGRRNRSLAFSASADRLLGLRGKHQLEIWSPLTGDAAGVRHNSPPTSFYDFVWSRDSEYVAATLSSSPTIALLQLGEQKLGFLDPPHPLPRMQTCVAISDDGYHVVSGDIEGRLHRWTVELDGNQPDGSEPVMARWEDRPPVSFAVHNTAVTSVRLSPDGQIISTAEDGYVRVTEPGNAAEQKYETGGSVSAVAEYRDGQIFMGSADGRLDVFDPATGRKQFLTQLENTDISSLSYSEQSSRLAVGFESGRVDCLDLETLGVIWTPVTEQTDPASHCVAISPNGNLIASTAHNDRFQLWDVARREAIVDHTLTRSGYCAAFSPDNRLVACGSDGLLIFDTETGAQILYVEGGRGCYSAVFSQNGTTVATGNWSRDVRLIDVATGKARILRGHNTAVSAVGFSADGRSLLSLGRGGLESTIRVWDVEFGEELGVIPNSLPVYQSGAKDHVLTVTDTHMVVAHLGGSSPALHVWPLSPTSVSP